MAEGAVQLTVMVVPLEVSVGAAGASGFSGMGVALTVDQGPFPTALLARTRTSYSVLLVNPVIVALRVVPACGHDDQPPDDPVRYCTS